MRIIKNNNSIEITCKYCDSILAITKEDILDYEISGIHVECAACGRLTQILTSSIPKDWWNDIKEGEIW